MANKKPIKLSSIEDIIDNVTEENAERFLNDFCVFLALSIDLKSKLPAIRVTNMVWKDDGKHEPTGITYNGELIKIKKKKNGK